MKSMFVQGGTYNYSRTDPLWTKSAGEEKVLVFGTLKLRTFLNRYKNIICVTFDNPGPYPS